MLTFVSTLAEASQEVQSVRKAIEDFVYTAVGLGVLTLQEIRVRRRETGQCATARVQEVQEHVESLSRTVQGWTEPLTSRLPRLPLPSLLTRALDTGRAQVESLLRRHSPAAETTSDGTAAAA
jgi:hypothetical protein